VLAAADSQTWHQGWEILLALGLSSLIGLEREYREKSAGLRTHALVGAGAALFMLVSKYGFGDVIASGRVVLDPSRVAAQIVSGIGFLGAGTIFVRRADVKGLTTAATIWLTAAVGAAAGAGLVLLAAGSTLGYFVVAVGYTPVARRLGGHTVVNVVVRYDRVTGGLGRVLEACSGERVEVVSVRRDGPHEEATLAVTTSGGSSRVVELIGSVDAVEAVQTVAD
jgi:putative Mg2+ transporter-C (MgtC) family protein